MARMTPDPTFYPSADAAMQAPREHLAYVATISVPANGNGSSRPDALVTLDIDPDSTEYGRIVGRVEMPFPGDELHHFGWNACSSALCPTGPHPHVERRYLLVPGLRSSRIHILDTKPDAKQPRLIKVIDAAEVAQKTGYSRLHTTHCGPDGVYVNALGAPDGGGPGGVLVLDHENLSVKGAWEKDRGPQQLAYDFWWHLGHDTMITSEWGTPNMVEDGLNPELLLGGKYGHALHVWDLKTRKHMQTLDLGPEQQMVLELRPSHDPNQAYGFAGVVVSLKDLSASIWLWRRESDRGGNGARGDWSVQKVIEIPAEPADPDALPPALKPFSAVPPLVSDINLSLDDRYLYVSCWGTGEFRQYDVSTPTEPRLCSTVRLGGIVSRAPHPSAPDRPLSGAPQMVEVSRDGRRAYITNSLYASWDAQFYPDGIDGWLAKLDVDPDAGTMRIDPRLFVEFPAGQRPHQVRLEGGDSSSDSFCFPSHA